MPLSPDSVGEKLLVPWRREMLVDVGELADVLFPDRREPLASAKVVARTRPEPFCVLVVE